MRKRRSKPWIDGTRSCRCLPGGPSDTVSSTSAWNAFSLRAFDTKTGVVLGKTVRRHTSQEFVAFLEQLVASHKRKREIHVILDNLSAHKTAKVAQFLEANPKVRLHFTSTYSSWLNKIELWFSKIERALIHRGVFTSTHDLTRKIMRYIRKYNEDPKPVKWTYNDPSRRIKTTKRSVVTVH